MGEDFLVHLKFFAKFNKLLLTSLNIMREDYLHQIWLSKRLPMHQLALVDGRKLNVLKTGWHNHESGPDFFNGSIEIEGIQWNGNIEIHIKSSDWYAHKHQEDRAYDNVVLHVVYQFDKLVYIGNEEIPTLELKPFLDQKHWFSYDTLMKNSTWIPCENQLSQVDSLYYLKQIESALIERLERKSALLHRRFQSLNSDFNQLQYEVLAQAFGNKVNSIPFVELAHRMPIKVIWREGKEMIPNLLLGAAGFLESHRDFSANQRMQLDWKFLRIKHNFQSMEISSWKFKGVRPKGFPPIRITQFAHFLSAFEHDFNLVEKPIEFWHTFFESPIFLNCKLSKSFQHLILINAIVPLLFWYGDFYSDSNLKQKALDLLESLDSEKNELISNWKKRGIESKSAADSQGLLELKNEICNRKKCLSCQIGNKILGKS